MVTETIDKLATVTYRDDKVLHLKFLRGSSIDIAEAEKVIALSSKLSNNEIHGNLVDTSEMMIMTRSARAHFAKQDKSNLIGIAVVINSKMQSILANMYLTINKPVITTKMFDNLSDAENWIISQIKLKNLK
jgi:hypothetical protein